MVTNRARTIELYMKHTGETDVTLVSAAYDALLEIHGFGVNGGMTRQGLEAVARLAAENGAKTIPIESWADFRFQEETLKQNGRGAGGGEGASTHERNDPVGAAACAQYRLCLRLDEGSVRPRHVADHHRFRLLQ